MYILCIYVRSYVYMIVYSIIIIIYYCLFSAWSAIYTHSGCFSTIFFSARSLPLYSETGRSSVPKLISWVGITVWSGGISPLVTYLYWEDSIHWEHCPQWGSNPVPQISHTELYLYYVGSWVCAYVHTCVGVWVYWGMSMYVYTNVSHV